MPLVTYILWNTLHTKNFMHRRGRIIYAKRRTLYESVVFHCHTNFVHIKIISAFACTPKHCKMLSSVVRWTRANVVTFTKGREVMLIV